jgi:molybdenum cofactor cytidylyltransferase
MLSDQPHVTPQLLRKLIDRHNMDLSPVVAPSVDGIRTTPVLLDRVTFPALKALVGDVGGRAIFPLFPPVTIPWSDPKLLMDVDTLADLSKLT